MKCYKSYVTWFAILAITVAFIMPPMPAYASSLSDILAQSIGSNTDRDKEATAGNNSVTTLVGLLMSNFLGKILNVTQGISEKIKSPIGLSIPSHKELVGFYAEWWGTDTSSFNSLTNNIDMIKTIAPFWATLDGEGTIHDRGGNDHASVVKVAHQNNVSVLLMVNNAKQEQHSSSPLHTVLTNPSLRAKAITNIETYIKKYNLDGINIDFEMVDAGDRDSLSAFMKELSTRLKPQGYIISIDVFPKQDESNDVSVAYDYAELTKYADKIMLMTYDNHGSWSGAGPIADIRWVENSLKYALKFIPKNKLYLGIAGYGYDWSSKGVESLEYGSIMKLADGFNSPILWDEPSKSPHFSYTDSDGMTHQVWYENSKSIRYKLDLVNKYDIAGAALWKLGEEDPGYWQVFKKYFSKK
ncbi:MAG: glycoside hydrolase family 18 [Sporomusaceae bacterium]|nr:glycoside hydrolase family 18 [Sporomusaceae bacterium]